jgi:hypothetical protein
MNLSKEVKITTALDYASGTADREGAILDMQGFEGVLMIVKFAAIHNSATLSIKAQQDTDPAGGTMADLLGTAQVVAGDDDNEIYYIDVYKPTERYVRLYVDKDTSNAVAESAIYLQYGPRKLPTTHATGVTGELHASPAEGTA